MTPPGPKRLVRTPARPKSVEVEGATVKQALTKALQQLNARRDQVTVKILAEEERGLFGMKGASQAKVRVAMKEPPARP